MDDWKDMFGDDDPAGGSPGDGTGVFVLPEPEPGPDAFDDPASFGRGAEGLGHQGPPAGRAVLNQGNGAVAEDDRLVVPHLRGPDVAGGTGDRTSPTRGTPARVGVHPAPVRGTRGRRGDSGQRQAVDSDRPADGVVVAREDRARPPVTAKRTPTRPGANARPDGLRPEP